jgi:hypothetical protein
MRAVRVTLAVIALSIVTGCTGSAGGAGSASSVDRAGQVALAYARALFAGDFATAQSLVEPDSQSLLGLIKIGYKPDELSADIRVGATVVTGDLATTTLLGEICHVTAGSSPTDCVSNTDPGTADPIFRVNLIRSAGRDWQITLRTAGLPTARSTAP